jgi:hypothetical protein
MGGTTMSEVIADHIYRIWLGDTYAAAMLNGKQAHLCLKRFIQEVEEGKIWIP